MRMIATFATETVELAPLGPVVSSVLVAIAAGEGSTIAECGDHAWNVMTGKFGGTPAVDIFELWQAGGFCLVDPSVTNGTQQEINPATGDLMYTAYIPVCEPDPEGAVDYQVMRPFFASHYPDRVTAVRAIADEMKELSRIAQDVLPGTSWANFTDCYERWNEAGRIVMPGGSL